MHRFEHYPGACRFVGCRADGPHSHLVCERCGALDNRGDCPLCGARRKAGDELFLLHLQLHGLLPEREARAAYG